MLHNLIKIIDFQNKDSMQQSDAEIWVDIQSIIETPINDNPSGSLPNNISELPTSLCIEESLNNNGIDMQVRHMIIVRNSRYKNL